MEELKVKVVEVSQEKEQPQGNVRKSTQRTLSST